MRTRLNLWPADRVYKPLREKGQGPGPDHNPVDKGEVKLELAGVSPVQGEEWLKSG